MIRFCATVLLTVCAWVSSASADPSDAPIKLTKISLSTLNFASEHRRLEAVGAYTLQSPHPDFGAFSGLRLSCSGDMVAITDTGFWFTATVKRKASGEITLIDKARFKPVLDEAGKPTLSKWLSDFESVTVDDRYIYLGAEQKTRVLRFPKADDFTLKRPQLVPAATPSADTRENNGFEAMATLPDGGLVVLHERKRKKDAPVPGFILKDGERTDFRVFRSDNYSITDADVAGDELLLLERRITPVSGNQMRIRAIKISELKEGALLEGFIIHQSLWGDPVDNMEGLSICETTDGYRLSLISDDNHWPLQRTLFLEFMLMR